MKEFFKYQIVVLAVALFCYSTIRESKTLKEENSRLLAENRLLQEQTADQDAVLRNRRTYEEGFRDAMNHSDSSEYVRGYHQAIAVQQEMAKFPIDPPVIKGEQAEKAVKND